MKFLCLVSGTKASRYAPKIQEEYVETEPATAYKYVEEELTLDIYGSTEEDINRCKLTLDQQFEKAMQQVDWAKKATYSADRSNIAKLSSIQVPVSQNFI